MPYPAPILSMAQNLKITRDQDVDEIRLPMLWNTILNFHFPIEREYGVAPQRYKTVLGTESGFLVVKALRDKYSIVLVVKLRMKPKEDISVERKKIMEDLTEYIDHCFDENETQFSKIFATGGIGLSFVVYEMKKSKSGPTETQLVFDWASDVTAVDSFDRMGQVVTAIEMIRSNKK